MQEFICIIVSLGILVLLLQLQVKLGRAMVLSSVSLAILLSVTPQALWQELADEWGNKELSETTGYLLISLTALLLLVNVLGKAMQETGVSQKLLPALLGLFKSRRFALALIPMMMGLLPTPGGIMLSAPMVRDAGDKMGISRSRLAAINFHFRHLWEPAWPLFPAIQYVQTLFGITAFTLIIHNVVIPLAGILGGLLGLLVFGIPPKKQDRQSQPRRMSINLIDFFHGFWPIVLAAILYVGWHWPPAVGIFIGIFGFLLLHKVPFRKWGGIFQAAAEPDKALLIFGALMFGVILRAASGRRPSHGWVLHHSPCCCSRLSRLDRGAEAFRMRWGPHRTRQGGVTHGGRQACPAPGTGHATCSSPLRGLCRRSPGSGSVLV